MRRCKRCGGHVRWSHIWDAYWAWLHADSTGQVRPAGHTAVVDNAK